MKLITDINEETNFEELSITLDVDNEVILAEWSFWNIVVKRYS